MKASELRIGNIVYDVFDKRNICKTKIGLEDLAMFVNYGSHPLPFLPITITEQILIQFGFKKVNNYFEVGKRFLYFDEDDKVWYLNTDKHFSYCDNIDSVKYIHELQNVYYWSSKDDYMFEREELNITL